VFDVIIYVGCVMPPPSVSLILHRLTGTNPTRHQATRYLADLEGIAFLRRCEAQGDQVAWDHCGDHLMLLGAIGTTRCSAAVRVLGHAVKRYRELTLRGLTDADPMEYTDALLHRDYLLSHTPTDNIMGTVRKLLDAAALISDDASRDFCEVVRLYLPSAPFGFGGFDHVGDIEALDLLGKCHLTPGEAAWVNGISMRLTSYGKITGTQREQIETLLRLHGGWSKNGIPDGC